MKELLRRIVALEPVAVQAVARAVFVLAAAIGLGVSAEVQGRVLAVIAALYALIEAVTTLWARSRVTPAVHHPADGA
jgi:hypothetical protein